MFIFIKGTYMANFVNFGDGDLNGADDLTWNDPELT